MSPVSSQTENIVTVPVRALDEVRVVLRAVAAGEPVDNAAAAAKAAHALAALPAAPRRHNTLG